MIGLVAIGVVGILVMGSDDDADGLEASGTVEAVEADLGFNLPGRVAAIPVREGDRVAAGEELARLEVAELEARRAAAVGRLESARAILAEMQSGAPGEELAQGRAAVRAAARRAEEAGRELERARALHEGGAISRRELDRAVTARELAEASLDQARQQLAILQRGPRRERVAGQQAAVAAAEAVVAEVDARLADAVIRAPFAGRVALRHREPGETVQPGQPVVTVMNPEDRWVQIYLPEDRIGRVSIGQEATIRSDSYPDREYPGRISFIADEAEFTPRSVQTREERVKLVYEVRVRIVGDPELVLKPGVPADVTLGPVGPEPTDG